MYDPTGNLIKDKQEGLQSIDWNAYGKVKMIKDSVTGDVLHFNYDGGGNRIWKEVVKKIPNTQDEDHKGEYYVRDAQGNILAVYNTHSTYGTKLPIKEATDPIIGNPGLGLLLAEFQRAYGSFGGLFTERMAQDRPVWLEGQIDGKSVGFYLERSEELMNRMVYSTPDYLNALQAHDVANPGSEVLYPALLNNNADGGAGWYGSILTQETEGEKLLEQYGKKMDEGSSDQLWGEYGLSFDGSNPVTSAQALYGYAQSHNQLQQLGERVAHYVDAGLTITPPTSTEAFMKAVVADDVIWESSALRAGGGFVPFVQQSLDRHGERSKLVSFFNGWTDSRYWLEQNSAPDQLFGVVLNDAPATVIGDHLSGETDAELISTVIADMPELTVGEYLSKLVTKGLLDGATMPEHEFGQITDTIRLAEHHIYGSSRLGVQRYAQQLPLMSMYQYGNPSAQVRQLSGLRPWYSAELGDWIDSTKKDVWALDTAGNKDVRSWKVSRILGYRSYELSDHLGNVLATVLDRKTGKVPVDVGGGLQQYSYWNADLASVQDYYPFGMQMPGRFKFAGDSSEYRFGFNGQMKTDEIAGRGNHNTAKFWEYDARTAWRWNRDPVTVPSLSPYSTFRGNPVIFSDVNGDCVGKDCESMMSSKRKSKFSEDEAESHKTATPGRGSDEPSIPMKPASAYKYGVNKENSGKFSDDWSYVFQKGGNPIKRMREIKKRDWDNEKNQQTAEDLGTLATITETLPVVAQASRALRMSRGAQSVSNGWMDGSTVLGTDEATLHNSTRMVSEEGVHQILLHGTPEGFVIDGVFVAPKELARNMLNVGFQRGTKIRLISCHTGVYGDGAAYQLSRYLKSPVIAPTNKIRIMDNGQYEIFNGGRFRIFNNTTIEAE